MDQVPEIDDERREYYLSVINQHRISGAREAAVGLAKSLNIELPGNLEQVALKPENAMDWAIRVRKIEKKFKQLAGGNLDEIPLERLKDIELDPIDVQGTKLSFIQFYARLYLETTVSQDPDMTPDKLSILRGGGRPIEKWMAEKFTEIEEDDSIEGLTKALENLEATSLVVNPVEGFLKAGHLLVFADKVEKAKKT